MQRNEITETYRIGSFIFCFRLLRHHLNHRAYIGPRMPPANAGMMNVYAISQKSMAICFC